MLYSMQLCVQWYWAFHNIW